MQHVLLHMKHVLLHMHLVLFHMQEVLQCNHSILERFLCYVRSLFMIVNFVISTCNFVQCIVKNFSNYYIK